MLPQVQIKQGILEGKQCEDFFGRQCYSFQGVPFAKPPLGKLRFKAPLPSESWEGVRDATKEQEGCYCYDMLERKFAGQEDCLYLNVFTPQLPGDKDFCPKPVMVYIHGGGFTSGSATEKIYGPKFLLAQDVILVTITYRLGVLGFLSLQDMDLEVPGNAGLKDQVMALRWVQENIKCFGGDPGNVTIFGESAGGASVHYLVISPITKGLFHKAIIQSGTLFETWARAKPVGMDFCYYMNIAPKNEAEMLDILLEAPVHDILIAQMSMKDLMTPDFVRSFAPVVEKPNKDAFLSEDPMDILIQGRYNKVPIVLGYNSMEGLMSDAVPDMKVTFQNLQAFIPHTMRIEKESFIAVTIASKLKQFYFPNNAKVEGDALYQLFTDTVFLRGTHISTKYHSSTSPYPVYLYRFSMDGKLNVLKEILKIQKSGACHGDELGYLFTNALKKKVPKGSQEYKGVMIMTRLWTNFARTGNPNGAALDDVLNAEWKPASKEEMNFLDIDFELTSGVGPDKERMAVWDEIFKMRSFTTKY